MKTVCRQLSNHFGKSLSGSVPGLGSQLGVQLAGLVLLLLLGNSSLASGPFRPTPEFFIEYSDAESLVAGARYSTRKSLDRTLLYLHLSGRFTPQHEQLFQRYLQRSGPGQESGFNNFSWRERAVAAGGKGEYISQGKWLSETIVRDNRSLVQQRYVLVCHNDAFTTAVATLEERQQRYGADSQQFQRWLAAQQQVFANCSANEASIPADAEVSWDKLEQQDRQYQIAAAWFYNQQYKKSAGLFREIAEDSASPWADLSRYLVARSLLYQATINKIDINANLQAALALYREMAEDEDYAQRFPSVRSQINYIELTLDSETFLQSLARTLLDNPAAVNPDSLHDYFFLSDHRPGTSTDTNVAELLRWNRLALNRSDASTGTIVKAWQDSGNIAWLYLALQRNFSETQSELLDAVLEGAEKANSTGRVYAEMLPRQISLLRQSGRATEARSLLQRLLSAADLSLPDRVRNSLQYAQAELSDSPQEYLRLAQLHPTGLGFDNSKPMALSAARLRQITRSSSLFTDETVDIVNFSFTPQMLLTAIASTDFGDYLTGRLALSAWVKALMLDEPAVASGAVTVLKRLYPEIEAELEATVTGSNREFSAAWLIMNHPGFSPWLPKGIGRIRDGSSDAPVFVANSVALGLRTYNWWCEKTPMYWRRNGQLVDGNSSETDILAELRQYDFFSRLSDVELLEMIEQQKKLQHSATRFFGPAIVDYARQHPEDARVPQALHRVVFASRHACQTGPGDISRAAFTLLHQQYPDSEWAAKTPYWYE